MQTIPAGCLFIDGSERIFPWYLKRTVVLVYNNWSRDVACLQGRKRAGPSTSMHATPEELPHSRALPAYDIPKLYQEPPCGRAGSTANDGTRKVTGHRMRLDAKTIN